MAESPGYRVPDRRLARWLDRFVAAPTWDRSFRVIERHPEVLRPEADALQSRLIAAARRSGEVDTAEEWEYFRGLLRRCNLLGTDRVLRELTSDENDEALIGLAAEAAAAYHRYHNHGDIAHVEAAIHGWETVVAHAVAIPTLSVVLSNLGMALLDRSDYRGSVDDADRAIALLDEAVARTPPWVPDRHTCTINLGLALLHRHDLTGDPAFLERAVTVLAAVHPPGLTKTAPGLTRVQETALLLGQGRARYARFRLSGASADLDAAIGAFGDVAERSTSADADRAHALNNLGIALSERYRRTASHDDLSGAITALERAISLTPVTSPDLPAQLGHLAGVLIDRYAESGVREDLDKAIALFARAAEATPADSAERPARDAATGTALLARYQGDGDLADLDGAVASHERATAGTSAGSPDLPLYLDQLGASMQVRARRLDSDAEAARAVEIHARAVALTGNNLPGRAARLNNLAGALRLSAGLSGDQDRLRRALMSYRQALDATPATSPERPAILNNLGNGLLDHARGTGSAAEFDEAVAALKQAVQMTSVLAPELAGRLCNLANCLRARHELTAAPEDLTGAIEAYRRSCQLARQANPEAELNAGTSWGMWALGRRDNGEAAEAFGHATAAIERLTRIQLTRQAYETWLAAATDVPAAAAFACAALDQPDAAVLHSERGRARLLSEALRRTRADLHDLRRLQPDLARRYTLAARRASALESTALRPSTSLDAAEAQGHAGRPDAREQRD